MSRAKRKPHEMATKLVEPCVCGSLWARPGIDFGDDTREELDLIDLCAGCKRRVVDGKSVVRDCLGCGEPVIDAAEWHLKLADGRVVAPIHGKKSCAVKASRAVREVETTRTQDVHKTENTSTAAAYVGHPGE